MLIPSKWSAAFAVERRPEEQPPDLADFKPTMFQGKAAYERISTYPGNGAFPDRRPPRFIDLLAFQRDGAWYRLIYWVADDRNALPPIILRYFNTFRLESLPQAISQDTAFLHKGPGTKDKGQRTKDK